MDATAKPQSRLAEVLAALEGSSTEPVVVSALSQIYSGISALENAPRGAPNEAVHGAIRRAETALCKVRGKF